MRPKCDCGPGITRSLLLRPTHTVFSCDLQPGLNLTLGHRLLLSPPLVYRNTSWLVPQSSEVLAVGTVLVASRFSGMLWSITRHKSLTFSEHHWDVGVTFWVEWNDPCSPCCGVYFALMSSLRLRGVLCELTELQDILLRGNSCNSATKKRALNFLKWNILHSIGSMVCPPHKEHRLLFICNCLS